MLWPAGQRLARNSAAQARERQQNGRACPANPFLAGDTGRIGVQQCAQAAKARQQGPGRFDCRGSTEYIGQQLGIASF